MELDRLTGEALFEKVLNILDKNGLLVENMRGQSHDGASAMSSSGKGVQGRITRLNKKAIYQQCNSHLLSLSIGGMNYESFKYSFCF